MATAHDLGVALDADRRSHVAWLAGFKKADGYDMDSDQVTEFHARNAAIATSQAAYDLALTIEKSATENETKVAGSGRLVPVDETPVIKTADHFRAALQREMTTAAPALKAMAGGAQGTVRFELPVEAKTLVTLADHYPAADRQQTTGMAAYYGDVEDLFQPGTTDSSNIEYFVQTTNTTNAAAVAEGSAVTDSVYVWTKVTDEVETVQAWIPVTREFLNDNSGMQSIVTGRLTYELQAKTNQQLLSGTGTTPQLWGAAIRVGFQTQARGTDPVFDAAGKAILKVQVTGDATPDAIVFHPTDWWNLRLTRTTEGIYILGNPGDATGAFTLWGLPVRLSTGVGAAGTALVGAFKQYAQVFNHGGVVVEASTEHSTYFTERKVALAVSRRLSIASYRPSAFATITGI